MLNRRRFLTHLGALGLSTVLPHVPTALVAINRRPAHAPDDLIVAQEVQSENAAVISYIERLEDLLDDLDCAELAHQHDSLYGVSVFHDEDSHYTMDCPFGHPSDDGPKMIVNSNHFWCDHCHAHGTAVDYHQRRRGCTYGIAVRELEQLLDSRQLYGKRYEQERQWTVLRKAGEWYHEILSSSPEGKPARFWLNAQGITPETSKRFQIGYAPRTKHAPLAQRLLASGFRESELEMVCRRSKHPRQWVDCLAQDVLVVPITDWRGRYWGFLQGPINRDSRNFDGCLQITNSEVSPRRLRRLSFTAPAEAKTESDTILITGNAWDVISLHNAGIRNVAYWLNGTDAQATYAVRSTIARSSTIIYPWRQERNSMEQFLSVMEPYIDRVRLLPLHGHSLLDLLLDVGPDAVRYEAASAVPLARWLSMNPPRVRVIR